MKSVLFRTPRPTTRQRLVGTADAAPAPDKIGGIVTFTLALYSVKLIYCVAQINMNCYKTGRLV